MRIARALHECSQSDTKNVRQDTSSIIALGVCQQSLTNRSDFEELWAVIQ